ncbi:hypothetical protein O3M35_004869 [Rhynocoris fuscipes]|uniref:Uncharacterized protein n=1 Tax=Rhynocoris fuscipes TaxID=488301 RepID=A0AAW1DIU9_9HEMI
MESLHKHIDPENLPEEWGGTRPSFSINLTRTLIHLNEHKFKGKSLSVIYKLLLFYIMYKLNQNIWISCQLIHAT